MLIKWLEKEELRKSTLSLLEQPVIISTVNSNIEIFQILTEKIQWKNIIDKNKLFSLEEIHLSLWIRKLKELLKFDVFYSSLGEFEVFDFILKKYHKFQSRFKLEGKQELAFFYLAFLVSKRNLEIL